MDSKQPIAERIVAYAKKLGFDDCGIASVQSKRAQSDLFLDWLNKGYNANMDYMKTNVDLRLNPELLLLGAQSIIVVVVNYNQKETHWKANYKVAKFAQFTDYHYVIKRMLDNLLNYIQLEVPNTRGRICVDSAPVMERYWAVQAGLGFIGKNTMFIHPKLGSYVFLGSIITDLYVDTVEPSSEECQGCGKCIAACPNQALVEPYKLDSNKCISYQTIEKNNSDTIDEGIVLNNQIFGCDICNSVCPHNDNVLQSGVFQENKTISMLSDYEWESLGSSQFKRLFSLSPIQRVGLKGIRRNIAYINRLKNK